MVTAAGRPGAACRSCRLEAAWLVVSLRVFADATDRQMRRRVLLGLPTSRAAYPPPLHELLESTLASARVHPDPHIRRWAAAADHERA